jgi:hypothetical protein
MMIDYYAILGVSQHAGEELIRAAFREKARLWHPDVCHSPEAHERFLAISRAYSTLIDPTRRAQYDRDLARADKTRIRSGFSCSASTSARFSHKLLVGLAGVLLIIASALAIAGTAIPLALPPLIPLLVWLLHQSKLIGLQVIVTYTILASCLLLGLLLLGLGLAYLSA